MNKARWVPQHNLERIQENLTDVYRDITERLTWYMLDNLRLKRAAKDLNRGLLRRARGRDRLWERIAVLETALRHAGIDPDKLPTRPIPEWRKKEMAAGLEKAASAEAESITEHDEPGFIDITDVVDRHLNK